MGYTPCTSEHSQLEQCAGRGTMQDPRSPRKSRGTEQKAPGCRGSCQSDCTRQLLRFLLGVSLWRCFVSNSA